MLTLPIKQEWFDMICRGEKREEYREATEYYKTRINSAIVADPNCKGQAYKIFPVKIRAGYNSKAPAAILRVHCIFGKGGVREWGADPDKYYYILQILHIESIENWKGGNMKRWKPERTRPLPNPCAVKPACIGKISTACASAVQAPIAPTSRTAMTAAVTGSRKSLPHNPRRIRRTRNE